MSVPAILEETGFEPDPGFRIHTVVPRTRQLLAVLLLGDSRRQVVMIEQVAGRWELPTMRIESSWDPHEPRPSHTQEIGGITQLSITRHARPATGNELPSLVWISVSGLAAEDAEGVSCRTEHDRGGAPVPTSGVFFAVLRGTSVDRPRISVQTVDHRIIDIVQPGQY